MNDCRPSAEVPCGQVAGDGAIECNATGTVRERRDLAGAELTEL